MRTDSQPVFTWPMTVVRPSCHAGKRKYSAARIDASASTPLRRPQHGIYGLFLLKTHTYISSSGKTSERLTPTEMQVVGVICQEQV